MAPALALLTAADSGAELRWHVSTPSTPRKYADRSAAPKFCCNNGWWVGGRVDWLVGEQECRAAELCPCRKGFG